MISFEKFIRILKVCGVSAGGYASILFGSLCKNVTNVISFIPKTKLDNPLDTKYKNIKNFINPNVKYTLYGDINIKDIKNPHHISHCELIEEFENVTVIRQKGINMKVMRDNGQIKNILDKIILS